MRNILALTILTLFSFSAYSQTQTIDSLTEVIDKQEERLSALEKMAAKEESSSAKLSKLKISGYVQAEFRNYQSGLVEPTDPYSTFLIRRARIKFTYDVTPGVKIVLQSELNTKVPGLQDAYVALSVPKLKNWALWAGQFNRPNYEVETSASSLDLMERSRVIRVIYPGLKEVGVKLEYNGSQTPLLFQFAIVNGNFNSSNPVVDSDTKKDLMSRVVYSFKLPESGIDINLGVNGYYGGTMIKTNPFVDIPDGGIDSAKIGDYLDKRWAGGEIQIFSDFLGGLTFKGEYVAGINNFVSASPLEASIIEKKSDPNVVRNFSGYYAYLIKNIGAKNRFVVRYDVFDPNTDLSGDIAGDELFRKTWTVGWQYNMNDYIRLSVQYEMPRNEINATNPVDKKDNTFIFRAQAKF